MFLLALAALLLVGGGTAYVASDDVRYLWRSAAEETRILADRRPLADVAADPRTPADRRALIELVQEARGYAARLGYEAKATYTQFTDVGRDTLLLVLSASPPECICPHTWKWPIVGRMPYKGFFDFRAAERERARLEGRGFDTYLRPSAAFSTLGWFEDPLLSTALTRDSVELAALVFHEIAHNTLYVKSATPFNESFAQYAGYLAAERFFRERGDTLLARRAADRWHDEIVLGAFYRELVDRLNAFYGGHPDSAALDSGRVALGRWAREQLEGPVGSQLRTYTVGKLADRPVNNARLVGVTIYRSHLDWFDAWHRRHGDDVAAGVAALRGLVRGAEGDSAFARLGRAVADSG